MGVQGLWELLAPVGRRVSVETLAGRKLAIDASIWIVQFMKAMRDDKGEMIRNAHLIGFFRRICKLLYLRVKPVFVFDGGTPALKRRTVIARRRQRERAQAKIRKTAEKLLLNHLRTRKLEELAQEIQNAKGDARSKNEISVDIEQKSEAACSSQTVNGNDSYEAGDALLAASLAAEEDGQLEKVVAESQEEIQSDESEEMDGSDEMILPVNEGKIDPAVLAVLPPSMQLDLLVQMREQQMAHNRQKFQKVKKAPASFSELQIQAYLKTVAFRREIDQVQKAASGRGIGGMPTSRIASQSDREFIFSSSFTGDKQALHFPGSNMSEAEGRPAAQEEGPVQSSVPSSTLTSSLLSHNSVLQSEISSEDPDAPIQTYIDEKGHTCLSRHRAMGVRMTRDLQWNLYLMKESEEQAMKHSANNNRESAGKSTIQDEEIHVADEVVQITDEVRNVDMADIRNGNESLSSACTAGKEISIKDFDHLHCTLEVASAQGLQISFTEDDIGELGKEDELFAALVAEESDACNHLEDDMSECEWEEGKIEANAASEVPCHSESYNLNQVSEPAPAECSVIDGNDEIEWEDGNNVVACETNFLSKVDKISSRKFLSEEEELQEAIRRSLEDFGAQKSKTSSCQLVIRENSHGMPLKVSDRGNELCGITDKVKGKDFTETEKERKGKTLLTEEVDKYCVVGNTRLNGHTEQSFQIPAEKFETDMDITTNGEIAKEKASGISTSVHEKELQDAHLTVNDMQGLAEVEEFSRPMGPAILNEVHGHEQLCQTNHIEIQNDNGMNTLKSYEPAQAVGDQLAPNTCASEPMNDPNGKMASVNDGSLFYTSYQDKVIGGPFEGFLEDDLIKEAEETDISREREALLKKEAELDAMKEENLRRKKDIEAELEAEKEALQASLDEEMVSLRQEDLDLQAAQKKHERNAESVTGEMFAECQELLQMFGLPYIIAPMEAEAQCAYLECIHLVDGVVTDDCDVFLFGACNVYKNIFDERKYVETYLMKDIEQELGLNREKLIRMALLLGSDYTEGISGIGIVNAIEVVNSFPDEDGLKHFKEWLDSPDPSLLNKVHAFSGKSTRKRLSNANKKTEDVAEDKEEVVTLDESTERGEEDDLSEDRSLALKKIFMAKHQAVSKNWHVPDTFPNEAVISAYTSPQVDKSTETFSWGRPDLMSLRKLSWERFGWNKDKSDEVLLPVLKEYDRHETQLRLEAFYSFNERFAKIRSRRIQKAVTGITGRRSSELMDLPPHLINTSQKKPRKKKENNLPEPNMVDVGNERVKNDAQCSKSVKNGKEERKKGNPVPADADGMVKASSRGRGRGQGKGRAGKRGAGRGRGRGQARNSTDDSGTEKEKDSLETGQLKQKGASTVGLRKSTRPHKAVKYALAEEDSGGKGQRDTDSDSDYDMSCEALLTKVPQKHPQTSPHSFTREGEHSDLEINWQQTGIGNPDVGSKDDQQHSDHLASGGGFCVEEDNHGDDLHGDNDNADGNVNSQQIEIENPDVGLIDGEQYPGYFATGGGFCVEEDNREDDLHNTNYSVNSTRANAEEAAADSLFRSSSSHLSSEHENVDYPSSVGGYLSTNHTRESDFKDVGNDNSCNEKNPYKADGIAEREQGTGISASVSGLRAMPFLRKRKRT